METRTDPGDDRGPNNTDNNAKTGDNSGRVHDTAPPVAYKSACEAGRAAIARARDAHLRRPLDREVLDALVGEVILYSRVVANISTRRLAQLVYGVDKPTGHQRDRVAKSLNNLDAAGVVVVRSGFGRTARRVVTFPTDEPGAHAPVFADRKPGAPAPAFARKPGAHGTPNGAKPGATGGQVREEHLREEQFSPDFSNIKPPDLVAAHLAAELGDGTRNPLADQARALNMSVVDLALKMRTRDLNEPDTVNGERVPIYVTN